MMKYAEEYLRLLEQRIPVGNEPHSLVVVSGKLKVCVMGNHNLPNLFTFEEKDYNLTPQQLVELTYKHLIQLPGI